MQPAATWNMHCTYFMSKHFLITHIVSTPFVITHFLITPFVRTHFLWIVPCFPELFAANG